MVEIDITNLKAPGFDKTLGQILGELVAAPTENFVELMKIAGLDGTRDFRYSNLTEVELDDADISGWDFTGCNLTGANFSKVRNIDQAVFTEETIFDGAKLPDSVTLEQLLTK